MIHEKKLGDEFQSTDEFSTQTTAKGSDLSIYQDFSAKKQKKSMLFQAVSPNERRGRQNSASCIDKLETIKEEIVYIVYWYDEESEMKHEVSFRGNPERTVKSFISIVIAKLNDQFECECLGIVLPQISPSTHELFMVKKKSGKPNLDFPSFDLNAQIGHTNLTEFALVVHQRNISITNHYGVNPISSVITSSFQDDKVLLDSKTKQQKKKNWLRRYVFCCNEEI